MNVIRLCSIIIAMCLAPMAQADVVFTTPGSGCLPNHAAIKNDRALIGNASVQHAANIVDPIVLTCVIPRFVSPTGNWMLLLTYQDSTGSDPGAFVRARLYSMPIGEAGPELLATVNSNASNATTLNDEESFFEHDFNFNLNSYWIRVELDRNAANQIVIFHSLTLLEVLEPSDIRLKHSVALLGHLDNGLSLYRFSYHGSDKAYVGVMAQEVEAIRPDAVVRGSDGYLRVAYGWIGLRMQTFEEWVAAGEKIPATLPPIQ